MQGPTLTPFLSRAPGKPKLYGCCQNKFELRFFLMLLCSRTSNARTSFSTFFPKLSETKLNGGCQPHYITFVHQCQTPMLFTIIILKKELRPYPPPRTFFFRAPGDPTGRRLQHQLHPFLYYYAEGLVVPLRSFLHYTRRGLGVATEEPQYLTARVHSFLF